jgi:hypothetical protein
MSSFIFYKNNSALIEKLKMILKKKLIPFYLYQDHESSELEHENLQIFQEIFKSHVEQVLYPMVFSLRASKRYSKTIQRDSRGLQMPFFKACLIMLSPLRKTLYCG